MVRPVRASPLWLMPQGEGMADIFDLFKRIGSKAPERAAPVTVIVAGLGNPGSEYKSTRHNAGFLALDAIAARAGATVDRARYHALVGEATLGSVRALLMKPTTFMNSSGDAIAEAAAFYKIPPERIIVLCDDISFAPGRFRIRRRGSAGGHNGLKSIIARLGSEDFPRVRIGVGEKPRPDYPLVDWVLGKFPEEDLHAINARLGDIVDAVTMMASGDCETAMNRYSR